jgi:hypothetical protein
MSKLNRVIKIAKDKGIQFYKIQKSPRTDKKFRIYITKDKYIDFGDARYEDFLDHGDEQRRERFHSRWKNNKYYNDKDSKIYYSRSLLW